MSNIINPYRFDAGESPFTNTYSVDFDGVNEEMSLGFGKPAWSANTMMGWYKGSDLEGGLFGDINSAGQLATSRGAIGWRDNGEATTVWYMTMGDGVTGVYNYGDMGGSYADILDGYWHHIALVIEQDGASCNQVIYVDGAEETTWTQTSVSAGTVGTENLSVASWSGNYWFLDGLIDEVALFNSALSETDISDIYNSGTPASLSSYSPYGWWRMGDNNGGTGTTITDQGSGGNDGTLVNGPSFSEDVP